MLIDDGYGNIASVKEILEKKDETLLELMTAAEKNNRLKFSYKDFGSLGKLVESINGRTNGDQGKFWQFWINHEYAKIGASSYKLNSGDFIDWKFSLQPSQN